MFQQFLAYFNSVPLWKDSGPPATMQRTRTISGQLKNRFNRIFGFMKQSKKEESWLRQNLPYDDSP